MAEPPELSLIHISELNWDVLVIDEAHEGVDTYKTDLAFDHIRRRFTLHLSGTCLLYTSILSSLLKIEADVETSASIF